MKTHTLFFHPEDYHNFEYIRSGEKQIETRAGSEEYNKMTAGDTIVFACGEDEIIKTIKEIKHFDSVEDLLHSIPYTEIMPWVNSVEEAKKTWMSYPNYPDRISKFGILVIYI